MEAVTLLLKAGGKSFCEQGVGCDEQQIV